MNESGRLAAHLERLRTVPGLGRDVTALVVMITVGIVAVVGIKSYLGGGAPWSHHTVVQAEFSDIPGLNPDSQNTVTIAGVKVGRVTAAKVTDTGTALVTMSLDGDYHVYQNARAVLQPNNPLDQMQVALNPGTSAAPRLGDGVIPMKQTETPVQSDDIFDHLDERSQAAVTDLLTQSGIALANAPADVPAGLTKTNDTLQVLSPVARQLATRRHRIAELVSSLAQISHAVGDNNARLARLASSAQSTLSTLGDRHGDISSTIDQLPGLTRQLRTAMSGTTRLTKQLDPTLKDLNAASTSLPTSLRKLHTTVSTLGTTVDVAKPVMQVAKPVIADLRPTVANANVSLGSLSGFTSALDSDTRTVMTYLLDDLEGQDLLTRRPNPKDRRARHVILTENGRAQLQRIRIEIAAAEAQLLVELSEPQRAQFRDLLAQVALTAQRSTQKD